MQKEITCAIVDDEPLAVQLLESYVDRIATLRHVRSYSSAIQAMLSFPSEPVDLVFLDIQMPEMNGMQMARQLPPTTHIIFTTAFPQYAVESYRVNAVDYLIKPVSFEEFAQAVEKAEKVIRGEVAEVEMRISDESTNKDNDYIFVRSGRKQVRVDLSKLLYAEAQKDYVRLVFESEEPIMALMPLKRFETMLPSERFIRIHRSFIVQKSKIRVVNGNNVIFGKTVIPVGTLYRKSFNELIG